MTTIAAIIPTYRRWGYLLDTVGQLSRQTRIADEVVVIDQTPEKEVVQADLARLNEYSRVLRIHYVRQELPSLYVARNLSAHLSSSDILLYLDDDVAIVDSFVEAHYEMYEDIAVDAVVGFMRDVKHGDINSEALPWTGRRISSRDALQFRPEYGQRIDHIPYICGGNFSIRKDVLRRVGGWDENIWCYGEKELGLRLFARGYNIVYDPRPRIAHLAAGCGGLRLKDQSDTWTTAQRASGRQIVAWRYLRGWDFLHHGLYESARMTFLLKKNSIRPWCFCRELTGWASSLLQTRKQAKQRVVCSFAI